ncbi:hypothetical protein P170DRAFT_480916 [Aspergillus steynii IBT 23096]|uniref:Uncharacterized protein n=1 Tax=Aspergillus steynii IBT 23096 TaxID=1392250 RepID=A0A2I2FTN6_9EURO|nr:uncharacterized protein P170DRAFT_480916 [Aspergillus steynii IBT 23096]PLB43974.1 hypothetical protein P170DRAFT_480916 [Aspergillus steynii IBT 23096]
MFLDQIPHLLCGFLLRYLNVLLYASSDNYFFVEAERLLHEGNRRNASVISLMAVRGLAKIIKSSTHYFLGHIMAVVMILESQTLHTHASALMHTSADPLNIAAPAPVSRSVLSAIIFMVCTVGLRVFFKGVKAAIVYNVSVLLLTLFLDKIGRLLFGPRSFVPYAARLLSSILLSSLHLAWTQAMICIPSSSTPASSSLEKSSPSTWRILALPSLFLTAVQILLNNFPRLFLRLSLFLVPEHVLRNAQPWQPKLASLILVTLCRLLLYFPARIALTLTEVRLLPEGDQTIIPSVRGRGARIGELGVFEHSSPGVSGVGVSSGLGTRFGLDLGRWDTVLWLWELHVKNSLVQFAVKAMMGRD